MSDLTLKVLIGISVLVFSLGVAIVVGWIEGGPR